MGDGHALVSQSSRLATSGKEDLNCCFGAAVDINK